MSDLPTVSEILRLLSESRTGIAGNDQAARDAIRAMLPHVFGPREQTQPERWVPSEGACEAAYNVWVRPAGAWSFRQFIQAAYDHDHPGCRGEDHEATVPHEHRGTE